MSRRRRWKWFVPVVMTGAIAATSCTVKPVGSITTVAGSVGIGNPLSFAMSPKGVTIRDNFVFITDAHANVVRRFDRTNGTMTVVAGTNGADRGPDAPSTPADQLALDDLGDIAVDPGGLPLFFYRQSLMRLNADGTRQPIASETQPNMMTDSDAGVAYVSGSGGIITAVNFIDAAGIPHRAFEFYDPNAFDQLHIEGLAMRDDGTIFYAEWDEYYGQYSPRKIFRINADGTSTYIAGPPDATNPPEHEVPDFGSVYAMVADGGNLLIASSGGLYELTPDGTLTNLTAPGGPLASHAGTIQNIQHLAIDDDGTVAAVAGGLVVLINRSAGTVQLLAGGVLAQWGQGSPATNATLLAPRDVAVGSDGSMSIATERGLLRVSTSGLIDSLIAGMAVRSVAFDPSGSLYFTTGHQVRVMQPDGTQQVVVNTNGSNGFLGDGGPAAAARADNPEGLAVDSQGDVIFADTSNHRVRKVSSVDGTITTIAGNGTGAFAGDGGPATAASLFFPRGVAVDADDRVYIADTQNSRVRRVDTDGTITTFAGGTAPVFDENASIGDGGPAVGSTVAGPWDVAIRGNDVFISSGFPPQSCWILGCFDTVTNANHRIRKVDASGTITTYAGVGRNPLLAGDGGKATQAGLYKPSGLGLRADGDLLVADLGNNRVRSISG